MAYQNVSDLVPPDEKNFGSYDNTEDQSFVHLNKEEAKVFDVLQGGVHLDPKLKIRSYVPLGELVKEEDFRKLFLSVAADESDNGRFDNPEFAQAHEQGKQLIQSQENKFEPAPGDEIPEIKELASKGQGSGRGHDTIMCMMPSNLIRLLGEVRGGVSVNPSTGYPEFGFWKSAGNFISKPFQAVSRAVSSNVGKSIVRVGTTVAGAVLGGPIGAAAGSVAGSALTGRKPKDWWGQALPAAAMAYVAPHIPGAGALGASLGASGIPGMASLGGYLGSASGPAIGAGALGAQQTMQPGLQTYHPTFQNSNSTMYTPVGQSSGGGGMFGNLFGGGGNNMPSIGGGNTGNSFLQSVLPYVGPAAQFAGGFMQNKHERDFHKMQVAEIRRQEAQERAEREQLLERAGANRPLEKRESDLEVNPLYGEPGEPYLIYKKDPRNDEFKRAYKAGGHVESEAKRDVKPVKHSSVPLRENRLIHGPGNGQDDKIHTRAPEGAYIIPAEIVSALGDGSTEAGAEEFSRYLESCNHDGRYDSAEDKFLKKKPSVRVALSRDEIYLSPKEVIIFGKGSHSKGIKILDDLLNAVRKHKFSDNKKLSPAAKSIDEYIKED